MRLELVKLQETVGITFIIVTHDQSEALAMADRIAVLESGRLRQVDTPAQLYQNPVDAFVADFIGKVNTFDTQYIEVDERGTHITSNALGSVTLPATELPKGVSAGAQTDASAVLAVRPESLSVSVATNSQTQSVISLPGQLGDIAFQGQHSIVEVTQGDANSITAVINHSALGDLHSHALGTPVVATCQPSDLLLLPPG